jgi:DNA-binding NarL/FixJ family response regulator
MIRILLADDHARFRDSVKTLLEQHAGMAVIGEAADGQAVLDALVRLGCDAAPDLVLLDVRMRGMDDI